MPTPAGSKTARLYRHFAQWIVLLGAFLGVLRLAFQQLPLIALHESIGYGDSWILFTVAEFRHTGILYPPVGPDHLTPVLYSPFLYLAHLAAWAVLPVANPYIGPRLLELFWFLSCVFLTGALSRRLVPVRSAFWLGTLLAASYSIMTTWVLQLRSDFPAITFSLLALWLLTSRYRRAVILAGACAGLAIQFKVTFVAGAVTGCLWLLLNRRWRALAEFAVAAGVFSLGIYAAFAWREPEMPRQMLMLKNLPREMGGLVSFFRQLMSEPGVLLALAGLLVARRNPRRQLVLIFVVISSLVAAITSLQPGANVNYFYEAVFAATPFAVLAFFRLGSARSVTAGLLIGLMFLTANVLPNLHALAATRGTLAQIPQRNRQYEDLRAALEGTKLLSSIPDITILTPDHVIAEPFLLNDLAITKGAHLSGLVDRIDAGYFDVVATASADSGWRGVPQLERSIHAAIMRSYTPYCMVRDTLFHLPNARPSVALAARLRTAGCKPVICGPGQKCQGLGVSIDAFYPTR